MSNKIVGPSDRKKKKGVKKESSTTANIQGAFAGGKDQYDPYAAGRTKTNNRKKERKPWYLEKESKIVEDVKASLKEQKLKFVKEAKISMPKEQKRIVKATNESFVDIANLYVEPVLPKYSNKDFIKMLKKEGGLVSLVGDAEGKEKETLPSKETHFDKAEPANKKRFQPKFDKQRK